LIFLGTNVISETLRKSPDPTVMAWLAAHDDSLAIPTVTIAEIAFGIAKIRPDECSSLLLLNPWDASAP
jgi:predicted nucleic acid-binding protein